VFSSHAPNLVDQACKCQTNCLTPQATGDRRKNIDLDMGMTYNLPSKLLKQQPKGLAQIITGNPGLKIIANSGHRGPGAVTDVSEG